MLNIIYIHNVQRNIYLSLLMRNFIRIYVNTIKSNLYRVANEHHYTKRSSSASFDYFGLKREERIIYFISIVPLVPLSNCHQGWVIITLF